MLTDEHKQILVEKVFEILLDNRLNREEIREIFDPVGTKDVGVGITNVVDRIIKLFIEEKLSIEEGVTVFLEIKGKLAHCIEPGF